MAFHEFGRVEAAPPGGKDSVRGLWKNGLKETMVNNCVVVGCTNCVRKKPGLRFVFPNAPINCKPHLHYLGNRWGLGGDLSE